ncbi:hypothetical protein BpHYR1_012720 [Brachionus plicatilis]|uniref:Uncharacterized protein n=1 Tax=Brachionus plicatilis TaxID=10195 RepID=A0A3M7QGU1_BRAPC|nr:hypothetical protein BpHYR1_012720 [Brachionus plicatilis]
MTKSFLQTKHGEFQLKGAQESIKDQIINILYFNQLKAFEKFPSLDLGIEKNHKRERSKRCAPALQRNSFGPLNPAFINNTVPSTSTALQVNLLLKSQEGLENHLIIFFNLFFGFQKRKLMGCFVQCSFQLERSHFYNQYLELSIKPSEYWDAKESKW